MLIEKEKKKIIKGEDNMKMLEKMGKYLKYRWFCKYAGNIGVLSGL